MKRGFPPTQTQREPAWTDTFKIVKEEEENTHVDNLGHVLSDEAVSRQIFFCISIKNFNQGSK